jgi:predicted nucleic acid-binding Zn ribbon protein
VKKKRAPSLLGSLVPGVLAELGFDGTNAALRLSACWEEVVGPEVARHCRPALLRGRTLEVRVDSSVWSQELRLRGPAILAGLAERLGPEAPSDLRAHVG